METKEKKHQTRLEFCECLVFDNFLSISLIDQYPRCGETNLNCRRLKNQSRKWQFDFPKTHIHLNIDFETHFRVCSMHAPGIVSPEVNFVYDPVLRHRRRPILKLYLCFVIVYQYQHEMFTRYATQNNIKYITDAVVVVFRARWERNGKKCEKLSGVDPRPADITAINRTSLWKLKKKCLTYFY